MNILQVLVLVGLGLIASGSFLCWYISHPAVQLKRQIKRRLKLERQAHQELDEAYEQAKTEMARIAREWRQP